MMTMNEYQALAARTIRKDLSREEQEMHGVYGLCAEAGEVAALFQKRFQGHEISVDDKKKEVGDCLWMLAEICTANGFSLEDVAHLNIEKLMKRYPDGFSVLRSLFREEDEPEW